jgi:hypothetical protein
MLAMKYMQERQDRWRQRTAENPKLKSLQHHNVNSAIEMAVNEGSECMLCFCFTALAIKMRLLTVSLFQLIF